MASTEPFTLVQRETQGDQYVLLDDVLKISSAKRADIDLQCIHALRAANPDMIVTTIPSGNVPLRSFAAAGFATCELDLTHDEHVGRRGYVGPSQGSTKGSVGESIQLAKYRYHWAGEDYILYTLDGTQFVLKERREHEAAVGPSKATDALILAIGDWMVDGIVWVFDGYWYQDKNLYRQVKKMSWDKVILDEHKKSDLTSAAGRFFAAKADYEGLGVPWKRGLLWHGPPGNGKTVSIKALMNTLLSRKPAIPTLYVKNAPQPFHIGQVFQQARRLAPCMLVLEDIETIVTPLTRSYFFNQMDGLEDNSGLFVIATTNFLDRLDPGLTKRPSRFDRKYLFPLPNQHERELYCQFWRHKLEDKPDIDFPEELCTKMAKITDGFSFAYLQECFVATLMALALERAITGEIEANSLWEEFKRQAETLRKQMDESSSSDGSEGEQSQDSLSFPPPPPLPLDGSVPGSDFPVIGLAVEGEGQDALALEQPLDVRDDPNLPALGWIKRLGINPASFELR